MSLSPCAAQDLEQIFTDGSRLSYREFAIEKRLILEPGRQELWEIVLSYEGNVIRSVQNESPLFLNFGLFSLIGERDKQLIIEEYSGGIHCCYSYWIYNLGTVPVLLYESANYPVDSQLDLNDIDKDGVYELGQSLRTFNYFDRCAYAFSPSPHALFRFERERQQYILANQQFSSHLLRNVAKHIQRLRDFEKTGIDFSSFKDTGGEYLGIVLQIALDYVYSGQEDQGWEFFEKEYKLQDKSIIRQKVRDKLGKDKIYLAL